MTAERSVRLPQRAPALTAEERLARYETLTRALATARTMREVAQVTAREACLGVGAIASVVMAPSEDGRTLHLFGHHGIPEERTAKFRNVPVDAGFPLCRAFATGEAEWFDERAHYEAEYADVANRLLPPSYTQSLAAIPIAIDGRVVLGVGLSFEPGHIPSGEDRAFVHDLVRVCAQVFERARLYEHEQIARAAAERLNVVLEAGDAVTRASDRESIVQRLVDVVVPRLADWCSVWLLEGGVPVAAAVRHLDASTALDHRDVAARKPPSLDEEHGLGAVLRTGKTELFTELDPDSLEPLAADPERIAFLRRAGVRSLIIVPLVVGERVLGAMALVANRPDLRYDAGAARLAEKLASRAAFALENDRLIAELRQHAEIERRAREVAQRAALRMRILAEASRAFSEARLDVHLISTSLATLVSAYLADGAVVMLVSDDGARLEMLALRHGNPEHQRAMNDLADAVEVHLGEGVLGHVAASGEAVAIDIERLGDQVLPEARKGLADLGARALAAVPLRLGGRVIGVLGALRLDAPLFDADDVAILQDLSDRAAVALANARLHAAEQIARKHVERLQSVTSALGEAVTPEHVADVILDSVMQELGGDIAIFYELADDGRHLVARRTRNLTPDLLRNAERLALDHPGLAPEAYRTRAPFFIEAIHEYRERFAVAAAAAGPWMSLGAFAVLPLVVGAGMVHGVVAVSFRTARTFSAIDRAFAMNLAEQSAQAIERARLYAAERAAKREAETASRLKDEFLATVSHELRTPLNAILGWASLLRSGRLDPDALERAIATIERNARTQARLVDDVLDVSRIISGKLTIRAEQVDVGVVLQQALDVVRPAALAKGVAIETQIAQQLYVRGDADRLQQVYWNVLFNAVKFTPRSGSIRVAAAQVDDSVRVVVADTGQGVREEFLPYLFEPFRQADGSTTRTHGGLGLGLSIAKRLVQLHGGEIQASSEGEGRGATFTVSLPATDFDVPVAGVSGRSRPTARLQGVQVLVVDDDEDARELTAMVLEGEGAEVRTASSARQAMVALDARTPAVLVCDIGMPEEDGLTLLPRARAAAAARGERFPALAFTAYADVEHVELVARAGFDAHLTKPVDAHALVTAVARLAVPVPAPTSSSVATRG